MSRTVVTYGLQQFYCRYENQQALFMPKSLHSLLVGRCNPAQFEIPTK